jgi:predicted nucleic acid-binding protein
MAANLPPPPSGAVVIDANIMIAIASNETNRDVVATAELSNYLSQGYRLFAPGAIIMETLYILCGKLNSGLLSPAEYAKAITAFQTAMRPVYPPRSGDKALIARAEQISGGYGCSRSADGIYIAVAEDLTQSMPTVLLTFDKDMPKQAAKNAPTVTVKLL